MDLSRPMSVRARMAHDGLFFDALCWHWSPDTDGMVNPLADEETQGTVRRFMADLWAACLEAEDLASPPPGGG